MTQISKFLLALFALLAWSDVIAAQTDMPKFRDYPVNEKFAGPSAPLVLTREARLYRTRLREAGRKPNFAGHNIVTYWGCGTECVTGAIINAKTGHVFMLPTSLCCWGIVDESFEPMEFRINSRLIVLTGARNETEGDLATRFYTFDGNRLTLVKTVPRKEVGAPPGNR